jgi:C1A family cysteine protease
MLNGKCIFDVCASNYCIKVTWRYKHLGKHGYGRIPDLGDQRDYKLSIPEKVVLPTSVDLRPDDLPVEDQLNLGSCTSFATGSALRFDRKKQGLNDFVMSHLFEYYNSRPRREKNVDSGASIRDAIKAAALYGICPESEWPYTIAKFASRPPKECYTDALQNRAIKYQRVAQNLVQLKSCLALGLPIVIGFTVYESFESDHVAHTGMMPLPKNNEQVLGGHAVLVVGYRDNDLRFIVKNSWGVNWADWGYFYMPYAYLLDRGLSSDFWVIQTVGK